MPQLNKGGKWVFGWVHIGQDGAMRIPPEALAEYGFKPGITLVFTRGSRTSGGFGLGREERLAHSLPMQTRILTQGRLQPGGIVDLPPELGLEAGERLLVVRGSCYALGFLQRGSIVETASQQTGITAFYP